VLGGGFGRCVAVGACAVAAAISFTRTARAADVCTANVWYRAAPQCPDGNAFIEKVVQRTQNVRLADAGDKIDFVVTIGLKQDLNVGRLERQTERGTVAIRELSGESCDEVADALALHLAMSAEQCSQVNPREAASTTPEGPPTPQPSAPAPDSRRHPSAAPGTARWSAVADALLLGATSPSHMPALGAFIQFAWDWDGVLRPALRAGALAGAANWEEFDISLIAGRIDLCPIAFGASVYSIRPCLNLDVGRISVETSRSSDHGLWITPGALLRLEYHPFKPVLLEVQAGALFPAKRYTVSIAEDDGSVRSRYRTDRIGLQIALGAGIVIP
jgi:hypothetical protein